MTSLTAREYLCLYRDETEPEMTADESVDKPEGWLDDEPELIPDPSSERPEDWYDTVDACLTITNSSCRQCNSLY